MGFPNLYQAIEAMVPKLGLYTPTARDIVRKAGVRTGAQGGGNGTAVLTCCVTDGERTSFEVFAAPAPSGYQWDDQIVGVQNWFVWDPLQSVFPWWPDGYEYGLHTTVVDLSTCSQLKNSWVVAPGAANPNVNIRVMASLDGLTWDYPTTPDAFTGDGWQFAGANVNCGGWFTYTADDVPYENYPPNYSVHEAAGNALPGGWTSSEWHDLKEEYRAENVYLRWTADFSSSYSGDPIYSSFDYLAVGFGEIRAR